MPAVARGDSTDTVITLHDCDATTKTDQRSSDVFVNSIGVHRQGDNNLSHRITEPDCPNHAVPITIGSTTVFANSKGIARIGDSYTNCGYVSTGSSNVFAGP